MAHADRDTAAAALAALAGDIRRTVISTIAGAGLGHTGGDLSVTDILTTLYGAVLRIDPARPGWPDRDRLILSKGHCSVALYTTLTTCGYFPAERLRAFAAPMSPLNGHPSRRAVPGVETSTGPLGHGLPVGVGVAVGLRLRGSPARTVVVLGDGELQEGSNWEAAMTAAHRGLASLTAVVDRNGLQQGARTSDTNGLEPLADKWRAFGWEAVEVDGHDHLALLDALTAPRGDRPRCVIARTVKGRGVSFMEDRVEWHHKVPDAEQARLALEELR
ncbi:transketolase [Nonomuraea phyllanthi]|uniref:Transketolase n=1 Tax=Nonomuraea phyllanthi TaxID=2219224 RepID=A0A5C4WSA9_9ACTN|nr:transketolase [Nonomuraea phyllanthi]QFY14190.1 transketolase [Nonomuraea phyllanthi]